MVREETEEGRGEGMMIERRREGKKESGREKKEKKGGEGFPWLGSGGTLLRPCYFCCGFCSSPPPSPEAPALSTVECSPQSVASLP